MTPKPGQNGRRRRDLSPHELRVIDAGHPTQPPPVPIAAAGPAPAAPPVKSIRIDVGLDATGKATLTWDQTGISSDIETLGIVETFKHILLRKGWPELYVNPPNPPKPG